jgi:hypothetical protein
MKLYTPDGDDNGIIMSSVYPDHVSPSGDALIWIMYWLIGLEPSAAPLHSSVTGVSEYTAGFTMNTSGALGQPQMRKYDIKNSKSSQNAVFVAKAIRLPTFRFFS